ncbi:hypothetical protein EIP91_006180 [Steccherinum ochraceum]|uniref:Uncharacterized protein n=1 Tax=Steccherinum ochraceum TaxID=92696 RepID=A0A4R0R8X6_9APHY|nr:hypothetical protein EIP91_006180 [Steccherinum ochraceum]
MTEILACIYPPPYRSLLSLCTTLNDNVVFQTPPKVRRSEHSPGSIIAAARIPIPPGHVREGGLSSKGIPQAIAIWTGPIDFGTQPCMQDISPSALRAVLSYAQRTPSSFSTPLLPDFNTMRFSVLASLAFALSATSFVAAAPTPAPHALEARQFRSFGSYRVRTGGTATSGTAGSASGGSVVNSASGTGVITNTGANANTGGGGGASLTGNAVAGSGSAGGNARSGNSGNANGGTVYNVAGGTAQVNNGANTNVAGTAGNTRSGNAFGGN